MKNTNSKQSSGVFSHLINEAAFFDKVTLNVWGQRRRRSPVGIRHEANFAIGGPSRFYARCIRARHVASGNNFQVRYGVMRPYKNLSPYVVTVWAGGTPVSCADVLLVLDTYMRTGYRVTVSAVEMTFDSSGIPLWRFTRDLITRAKLIKQEFSREGAATVYVGGRKNPWQLRIYQKTPSIVRVEFILRSRFLREHCINLPQELSLLRRLNLSEVVSFQEVKQDGTHRLPLRVRAHWEQLGHGLPPSMPASIILRELRSSHVDPQPWIVPSARELLLHKMAKHLVW